MKTRLGILALMASLLAAPVVRAADRTITLHVDGMTCDACPLIVKGTLSKVDGVKQVSVSAARKTAAVTFDDARTTVARLIEATTHAGYPSQAVK